MADASVLDCARSYRRRRALAPLVILVLVLAVARLALAETLRVGVVLDDPPLGFVDEGGNMAGLDIDVARALCAAIDAECVLVPSELDDLIPALVAHRLDFVVASLYITDARRRLIEFTRPYYDSAGCFVGRRERARTPITPQTAKGVRIGVERDTAFDSYATDNFAPSAEILRYGSQPDALLDLLLGRIDLVFGDRVMVDRAFLSTSWGKGFALVGEPVWAPRWLGDGIGVALRKGAPALRERLDRAVAQIRANHVFAGIARTWLGPDASTLMQPPPWRAEP